MLDYQVDVDGLTMGPNTNVIIHKVEGLDTPDMRTSDSPRPRDHGAYHGADWLDERKVTITGTVKGSSSADVVTNLDALKAKWLPVTDPSITKALTYKLPGQADRLVFGRPRRVAADTSRIIGGNVPFVAEFVCADPRIYSSVQHLATVALSDGGGGRAYPKSYPYSYGASVLGIVSVGNAGLFATRPTVWIIGPVTAPKLENVTTGESIKFQTTVPAGDFLVVDFDARTAKLASSLASVYSTRSIGSTWWELAPGASTIRFSAGLYDPSALAYVFWRDAWI